MTRRRCTRWLALALLLVGSSFLTSCHALFRLHRIAHRPVYHAPCYDHAPVIVVQPRRRCR